MLSRIFHQEKQAVNPCVTCQFLFCPEKNWLEMQLATVTNDDACTFNLGNNFFSKKHWKSTFSFNMQSFLKPVALNYRSSITAVQNKAVNIG